MSTSTSGSWSYWRGCGLPTPAASKLQWYCIFIECFVDHFVRFDKELLDHPWAIYGKWPIYSPAPKTRDALIDKAYSPNEGNFVGFQPVHNLNFSMDAHDKDSKYSEFLSY